MIVPGTFFCLLCNNHFPASKQVTIQKNTNMRSLSLTMPAALLLLLCFACNSSNQKADLLSRKFKDEELKPPAPMADNEVNKEFKSSMADSASTGTMSNVTSQQEDEQSPPKSPAGQHPAQSPANTQQTAQANPDWDKKIVKTANLNMEVKNFHSYNELLHRSVKQSGGYIAQEEQTGSDYKVENTVTIKVPVATFDETLSQLTSDSNKLLLKKVNTEDGSMQVVDTRSRLETKRQVRQRYIDLLKGAKDVDEINKVQNEINDVQEQMEGAAGRIAFLSHSAALSTINLNFYQVLDPTAKNEKEPSFFEKTKGAFATGWNWVSSVIVVLIGLWPLWVGIGVVWTGFWKWRSSRIRANARTSGIASVSSKG
jgi:hypothetical protein